MENKGSLPHSQEPTTFRFGSSSCSANQFTSPHMLRKSRAWKVLETLDQVLLIVATALRYLLPGCVTPASFQAGLLTIFCRQY